MEARGEKINASSGPSKEIAGLKKKMKMIMMMMKTMTPGSQELRVWEFSHEALKVRRGPLGLCVGTYGLLECSGEFLKPSYTGKTGRDHGTRFGGKRCPLLRSTRVSAGLRCTFIVDSAQTAVRHL